MTAVLMPQHLAYMPPLKRQRRTATAVLAGDFDLRPARDALTSLLNGIGPYRTVELDASARKKRRQEKREIEKEKKREKKARERVTGDDGQNATSVTSSGTKDTIPSIRLPAGSSSFWRARPTIHIATMQRSVSVTPPPMPPSPASTPGPSISSSTSRTSSKRPRTPADDEDLDRPHDFISRVSPQPPRPRKHRPAAKKGWKGWVEGSPEPSQKLINLDSAPILQERRTRSGKNFDAIGVGKDGWV